MADRLLKILEADRYVARGITRDPDGTWSAYQDRGATLSYTLDLTGWLGSDTIASVVVEDDGAAVSSSNTDTAISLTVGGVNGRHDIRTRITTDGGLVQDVTLRIREREF